MTCRYFFIFWSVLLVFCDTLATSKEELEQAQRTQAAAQQPQASVFGGLAMLANVAVNGLVGNDQDQQEDPSQLEQPQEASDEGEVRALLQNASEAARQVLANSQGREREREDSERPRKRARIVSKRDVQLMSQVPLGVDQIQERNVFLENLNRAIHEACVDKVKKNLQQGTQLIISSNGTVLDHPLSTAVKARHFAISKLLLQAGANANNKSFVKSLRDSVFHRNTDIPLLGLLLQYGLDPQSNFGTWHPYAVAAKQGNLNLIYYLFEHGFSLDTHSNIKTVACFAAEQGNDEMLSFVLKKNKYLASQSIQGHAPLHYAVRNGHFACAQLLIEEYNVPVNPNFGLLCYTPLMLAAQSGHTNLVKYLLAKGALINLKSKGDHFDARHARGKTALQLAEDGGHIEIARILRELQRAEDDGQVLVARMLRNAIELPDILGLEPEPQPAILPPIGMTGVDLPRPDHLQFSLPVRSQDCARLSSPPRDFSREGAEIFESVVASFAPKKEAGDDEVHNPQMRVGAGPGDNGDVKASFSERPQKRLKREFEGAGEASHQLLLDTDTIEAVKVGDIEKIQSCLAENPRALDAKDQQGFNLLHMLAYQGHFDAFLFVEVQCTNRQIYERTLEGATVLHFATMSGNVDLVRYLIEKGLSMSSTTDVGMTPFMCAAMKGHKDIVQLMLKKMQNSGAEIRVVVNRPSYTGKLPLIMAAARGYADIVQWLINHGACVDSYDRAGKTALAKAIEKSFKKDARVDYKPVISVLLAAGARLDQKMGNGQTIAEFVEQQQENNQDVLNLLGLQT